MESFDFVTSQQANQKKRPIRLWILQVSQPVTMEDINSKKTRIKALVTVVCFYVSEGYPLIAFILGRDASLVFMVGHVAYAFFGYVDESMYGFYELSGTVLFLILIKYFAMWDNDHSVLDRDFVYKCAMEVSVLSLIVVYVVVQQRSNRASRIATALPIKMEPKEEDAKTVVEEKENPNSSSPPNEPNEHM